MKMVKNEKLTLQEIEERKKRLEKKKFRTNIKDIFSKAGFTYIKSENIQLSHDIPGLPISEIDAIFICKNIIVIVEDTCSENSKSKKNHLLKALFQFEMYLNYKSTLINSLKEHINEFANYLEENLYEDNHYVIKTVYFSFDNVEEHIKKRAHEKNVKVIEKPLTNYFFSLVKNIMGSAKYELLKFLDVSYSQFGGKIFSGENEEGNVEYNGFLLPVENSSYPDGYKIVSFYIDPDSLLKKSFVLRKNSWIDPNLSYQRILDVNKIKRMRKHLSSNKRVYLSNIIVTLPSETKILDMKSSNQLDESSQHTVKPIKIKIPDRYNVIGIIDGQHRVYSYHESNKEDNDEKTISQLRRKQSLLVTGIIYPDHLSEDNRLRYEAQLFLEINSKQTKVKSVLTQEIELIVFPYSSIAIAKAILIELSKSGALKDKLEEHTFDDSKKLKVSSIVSYGIKPLINKESPESLFTAWSDTDKKELIKQKNSQEALYEFINFCVKEINFLLNAVKTIYGEMNWQIDNENRILTPTSVNGFLVCLRLILRSGIDRNIEIYKEKLKNIEEFDFTKYKSSQWNQLGRDIYNRYFTSSDTNLD
ncbi:hypothetical protein BHC47_01580 [Snodgrassella alvi]|uniref:DGQHR domain-containing protein n=1 Tax=Snodgrassella alvi TaxID=1196083 RepID=A0A2N9Y7F0_9NEIS|nr:DGQHR domain-containing protein [Snodgrassella alvi]PIT63597.1 hypothetical protein BHC56_05655 [Snodgrassella alvi]PIT65171.1 hypothetical protein BHC47_01580 [Snodgrassella alvi]